MKYTHIKHIIVEDSQIGSLYDAIVESIQVAISNNMNVVLVSGNKKFGIMMNELVSHIATEYVID